MKIRTFFSVILLVISASSCSLTGEKNNKTNPAFISGNGIYLINEGNFNAGNGSLSYYTIDSARIRNDIFSYVNGRPLGDVPYSMGINDEMGYIVVNNSGKIEIVDINTLKSQGTISGLNSPRNILFVSSSKAYVSSLWSNEISVLNLLTNSRSGSINIRRSSESLVKYGDKVYVSCWVGGKEIIVLNIANDMLIDSITVGHEPESMAIDRYNKLWVLCSGSYSGEFFPELVRIDLSADTVDRRLVFPSKLMYPSTLRINETGDTLYYINTDIYMMPVTSQAIPAQPFVRAEGRIFYKLGVSGTDHLLYATNVVDYQQNGYLLRIGADGSVIDSTRTDIIPGSLFFRKK